MTINIKPASGPAVAATAAQITTIKTDLGLNLVNNTADADKPVSTAVRAALNEKLDKLTNCEDVTTTSYTFVDADNTKIKRFTNPAGCTALLEIGLPPGFNCSWIQAVGAGAITFEGAARLSSLGGNFISAGENSTGIIIPAAANTSDDHLIVGALGALTAAVISDFEPAVLAITGGGAATVTISGTRLVGQTLTAVLPSGVTASAYQWTRNGADIATATAATYLLVTADGGTNVGVRVGGLSYASEPTAVPVEAGVAPALATASDTFDDGAIDTAKWNTGNFFGTASAQVVVEQNGQLEIAALTSTAGVTVSGLTLKVLHNLTGSSAYARLNKRSADSASHDHYLAVYSSATDAVYWRLRGSALEAFTLNGGVETAVGAALTYSASTHTWFRIREATGTIFFDTAPNTATNPPGAGDWVSQRSVAKPAGLLLNSVKVALNAGTNGSTGTAGTAIWDGFNAASSVPQVPPLVAAAPIALSDNFSDNLLGAAWVNADWQARVNTFTTFAEANGRIEIVGLLDSPADSISRMNGIVSAAAYDMTNKDVFVRHGTYNASVARMLAEFALFADANNGIFFEQKGYTTGFKIIKRVAGANTTVFTDASTRGNGKFAWYRFRYDSATAAWWFYERCNQNAPTTFGDPPAQSEWRALLVLPTFAALNPASVKVAVSAGWGSGGQPQTVNYFFDGVNVATV